MAFRKPLLSSHVGYITIHEPESHIQFGHVSHFFRQCVDSSVRYAGAKPFRVFGQRLTVTANRHGFAQECTGARATKLIAIVAAIKVVFSMLKTWNLWNRFTGCAAVN